MKRILTVLFILTIAVSAFALDVSAGVGASAAYFWNTFSTTAGGVTDDLTMSAVPLNFKAFLDATYLEASVGYLMMNGSSSKDSISGNTTTSTNKTDWLSIAAMFKYPFGAGAVTFFPLVGVEYDMNLSYKDASGNDLKAAMSADAKDSLNQFWIKAGVGADISFGSIYIRPEVMLGYKLLSKAENDAITLVKGLGATSASITPLEVTGAVLIGFKF